MKLNLLLVAFDLLAFGAYIYHAAQTVVQ